MATIKIISSSSFHICAIITLPRTHSHIAAVSSESSLSFLGHMKPVLHLPELVEGAR